MLPELEGECYKERQDVLGMTGDLKQIYKIMMSVDRVESQSLFPGGV